MEGCGDGTFQATGQKFFKCLPGRGLYYPLKNLIPDPRYALLDTPETVLETKDERRGEIFTYVTWFHKFMENWFCPSTLN